MLDGSPGFTGQVFDFLKEKADKRKDPLVVSLIVDEIAIMKQVTFNGEKFVGGVDKGEFGCDDELATDSLVFMVDGVNQHFKLPVGYFMIHSMKAEGKSKRVKKHPPPTFRRGQRI